MNLKNNEFVVSMICSQTNTIWAVTNFGRLFYKAGTNWVMEISNG